MPQLPDASTVLHWASLTESVNEMKRPNDFLKMTFFSRARPKPTRNIELSTLRRGRKIAPFVVRDGAAIMTEGRTEEFFTIEPPHIRTKRPMTPTELLSKRRAGTTIYPTVQEQQNAMAEYMASEFEMLMDDVMNSEEWLCAQVLRGAVSYTSQDGATFDITVPRDPAHSYALSGGDLWTASTASFRETFLDAAQLVNDAVSLNITDAIMGSEAFDAFLADAPDELQKFLDLRRVQTGTIDLTQQFAESGALFLGVYVNNIRIWRYARTVEVNGVSEDLIRPKYVEFIANTPAAQFVTYYGAIEDMKAIGDGNVLQSARFSKSWEEEDPSRRMLLVESNPMPWMRRPEATVSVQAVA